MNNLCVLIMAAGKGTRMKSAKPKVMQEILDQPLLHYVIRNVLSGEITEPENIAVLVGAGGEYVENYIKNLNLPLKILWQHEQLGTGHAVKTAQEWWKNFKNLIVLNGDLPMIKPDSIKKLASECLKNDCTIITFTAKNPGAYGRIVRENDTIKIVEFKDADDEQKKIHEVNAGCYAFKVDSLQKVIGLIKNNNAQKEYYLTDTLYLMNEQKMKIGTFMMPEEEMSGVNTQFELADISEKIRFEILNHWLENGVHIMDLKSTFISPDAEIDSDVTLMPNVQILGKSKIREGSFIGSGSILRNAVIGKNVNIIAYAIIENSELKDFSKAGPFVYIRDNSCLEKNSFAGKFVELKNSHVGENSKVPHLSYMGDAEIGHDVNIGAGSITCNYDGKSKFKTSIGNNCFVGSDTMLVAPVSLSDGAATAAGSVITQPVPEDSLGIGRARQLNIQDWASRKRNNNTHKNPEGD